MTPHPKKNRKEIPRNSVVWKELVAECFERDGYVCQLCGRIFPPNMLAPHHIKTVGSGGSDVLGNLISLCAECHTRVHTSGKWVLYEALKSRIVADDPEDYETQINEIKDRLNI